MKRPLDLNESEKSAMTNILAKLPRDLVIYLLKTNHFSIADVFLFCQTNIWTFQLCNDKNVWKEIYAVRFPNVQIKEITDRLLSTNPEGIHFRFAEMTGTLVFGPPLRLSMILTPPEMDNDPVTTEEYMDELIMMKNEIVNIINQIIGPPDEGELVKWSRDLGILKETFMKMIVYKILENDYWVDEPADLVDE